MQTEEIAYQCNNENFIGYVAYDTAKAKKRPAVLVAHAWRGQDNFSRKKAEELASLGYVGFAMDLYGNKIESKNDEESLQLMTPLFVDRAMLRNRALAALTAIKQHSEVDPNNIGAIGFCFGGLTVLEMAKSGADLKGVVSFHGVLGDQIGDLKAKLAPISKAILAKILVLHGHDDPLVPPEVVLEFEKEMTEKKADWQVHVYGNTMHAFTNPDAKFPEKGMQYNPIAKNRAWESMRLFFEEVFEGNK